MQTEISPLEPLLSVDHQKSAQTNLIITISTAQFQPVTHSIHLRVKTQVSQYSSFGQLAVLFNNSGLALSKTNF